MKILISAIIILGLNMVFIGCGSSDDAPATKTPENVKVSKDAKGGAGKPMTAPTPTAN